MKKALSILIAVLLLLSCMPMTVFAADSAASEVQIIDTVTVQITAPAVGEHPIFEAVLPEGAPYTIDTYFEGDDDEWYSENGVVWYDFINPMRPKDTFRYGGDYFAEVDIRPVSEDYRFAREMTVIFNGITCTMTCTNNQFFEIYYEYWLDDEHTIDAVDVQIAEPAAGAAPSFEAILPEDAAYMVNTAFDDEYTINGITWSKDHADMQPGDTFEAGETYLCTISLRPVREDNHFADDAAFTVNGNAAQGSGNSNTVEITYEFTVPDAPAKKLGDADGDGSVTALDMTYIQRALAHMPLPGNYDEAAADVDGDDFVTALDVTYIQRALAHMPIPYDIEI